MSLRHSRRCVTVQTSRGHTYFVAAHALCHVQHLYSYCESLKHAGAGVREFDVRAEERTGKERERQKEKQIYRGEYSPSGKKVFTSELDSHFQFDCGSKAHTYSNLEWGISSNDCQWACL